MRKIFGFSLLLMAGCASQPGETGSTASTPAAALTVPRATASPAPAQGFGLAWESYATYDGEVTGIESSTNLRDWKVESSWPLVVVSNTWRDTNPVAPAKFYRAFNE